VEVEARERGQEVGGQEVGGQLQRGCAGGQAAWGCRAGSAGWRRGAARGMAQRVGWRAAQRAG
jgi:hypothetical protein